MKELSVIIVSYNHLNLLRNCLDSIRKYNDIGDRLEVIVSDNSPYMDLIKAVKEEYPWVVTRKNRNVGFGKGNNLGYEISNGKYLLFLNPDTILVEPIFQFAIDMFNSNEELALFGLQLLSKNGNNNPSFYIMDRYGIFWTFYEKLHRRYFKYKDGKMYIAGADLFVRRKSFEQAGYFDENIFMYDEEPDLIKRIKNKSDSKKTCFFKEKHIIHLEGGTTTLDINSELSQRKRITASDKYYSQKWHMDFVKMINGKCRYVEFKSLFYLFTNRKKYLEQRQIIDFFKKVSCDRFNN